MGGDAPGPPRVASPGEGRGRDEPVVERLDPGAERQRVDGPRGGRDLRGLGARPGPPITEMPSPPAVRARDTFYRRILVAADVSAVACVWVVVVGLGGERLSVAMLLAPLVVVVLGKATGLYDRDELVLRRTATLEEVPGLLNVATLVALFAAIAELSGAGIGLTGAGLVVVWVSLVAVLVLFRGAARSFAMRRGPPERCLLVGDADAWRRVATKLHGSPHTNGVAVGYVPLRDRVREDDPPPLDWLPRLDSVVRTCDVHRVVIAPPAQGEDPSLDVVRRAKALGVKVSVLPRIFEVVGSSVAFDDVDGMTLLGVRRFGLARSSAAIKRGFDLVGATLGLLVVSPLLGLAAVATKLDSRGPVLFRQHRVGRNDEVFEIVKFRTMVSGADARQAELAPDGDEDSLFKLADDPRVTRVGRWLRKTSLDELPQLINVVRGEMSLVGPRPLVLAEDRYVKGWDRRRLYIRPGMTGPWQILGSARIPLYEMVKIDYLYVANWSLWRDVMILLRTAMYVVSRRNL